MSTRQPRFLRISANPKSGADPYPPPTKIALAGSVEAEAKPDISEGKPIPEATRITFSGNKKREIKSYGSSGDTLTLGGWNMGEADYSKEVHMAVGDDGHLWLRRKGNDWKRIVTE